MTLLDLIYNNINRIPGRHDSKHVSSCYNGKHLEFDATKYFLYDYAKHYIIQYSYINNIYPKRNLILDKHNYNLSFHCST